jgi:hypothetical protein
MIWTIELAGSPPCWIKRPADESFPGNGTEVRVTFQWKEAQKFTCREDANHEMLRLSLPGSWSAVGFARKEIKR